MGDSTLESNDITQMEDEEHTTLMEAEVDTTQEDEEEGKGEDEMSSFAAAAVAALCQCIKEKEVKEGYDFSTLRPLLLTTLKACPTHAHNPLCELYDGLYHLALTLGSEFESDLPEIVEVIGPFMLTLPVDDSHFVSLLDTSDKLCELYEPSTLFPILIDTCIRALRFSSNDAPNINVKSVKASRREAWNILIKWAQKSEIFAPHASDMSKVAIDLLEFLLKAKKINDILNIMPHLLRSVKKKKEENGLRRMWIEHWRTLKEMINEDKFTTTCMRTLAVSISIIDEEILSVKEIHEIGQMMKEQLETELRRRETVNDVVRNEEMEKTGGLLNNLSSVYIEMQKKLGALICQIVPPLMPFVLNLIHKCSDIHWGLRFIVQMVYGIPDFALLYRHQIVSLLNRYLSDNRPIIRRWVARSFGAMAKCKHPEWVGVAVPMVDSLYQLINREDARRDPECNYATEAAIASIVNIIKYGGELIGDGKIGEILSSFLDWFPINGMADGVGGSIGIYTFLIDLIEDNNQTIMGEPNAKCPQLVHILIQPIHQGIFGRRRKSQTVKRRIINIIKGMAEDDSFFQWVRRAGLNPDEIVTLQEIVHPAVR